ncbi:MAG: LPS assembly protein LptD [Pseudomonadota bacterium]
MAQGVATLVADTVVVEDSRRLVATGNIEAFYDGTRLSATQITYDQTTDQLSIIGPIFLQTEDGQILTADRATLDPRLENGLLRGARLVLDQQLQLAANRIDRVDGRFAQLSRVVVSSCNVCGDEPALWDIRAERVVHDQEEQQLYFDNATFRVRGVPILWLPHARLPDPTLTRATGFLIPRIRQSDLLGTGIKIPYFVTLGDSRDLTLTPYLSPRTRTLEVLYREAFLRGDLRVEGAVTEDQLQEEQRAYLFASGQFDVGTNTKLSFNLRSVSDRAYLAEYGYADFDRLESDVTVEDITSERLLRTRISFFESLRDDENNRALPPIVWDFRYEQVTPLSGGTLRYGGSADAVVRTVPQDGDAGRDVGRAGAFANWRRPLTFGHGVRGDVTAAVRSDFYRVNSDAAFEETITRVVPTLGATLTWPLLKRSNRATHLITPTVSVAWSDAFGDTPPNEDSTRAELDQANLFDLSRFPGDDRVEIGLRAALGFTYTRSSYTGSFATLTFGRVVRETAENDFSASSGLDGKASDWLVAGQITSPGGVYVDARVLVSDELETTRGAGRLGWRTDRVDLTAAYIWQAEDPTESRPDAVSEWTFDTAVKLNEAFTLTADARYDVANDSPARAGVGVIYRNECVTVDFSVDRRFTSSDTIEPSTDYGLSVSLTGFSAGRSAAGPVAGCTNR